MRFCLLSVVTRITYILRRMALKYSSVVVFLGIVGICSSIRDSYFNCPKETDAKKEVANLRKEVPANIFGYVTIAIHIPEKGGLLPAPITCIVATDLSSDGEGGRVSVISGGIGSKYADIRIDSKFLRGLNYRVEVWTA